VDGSHLLIAGERRPAVDGLGLDAAGIKHEDKGIITRGFRTTNPHVYAVGDAVPGPASVVRAEREAQAAVGAILGRRTRAPSAHELPRTVPTDPPLAAIGLTEGDARTSKREIRVLRYPFGESARAAADRIPDGLLKVTTTTDGRILGAAVFGKEAGEHMALWSLALRAGAPLSEIAEIAVPYPSRADIARALAAAAVPDAGLTRRIGWRIIRLLGKFG
jgi:pyruvate/2-oxoglutarate dehydrogenase complex dihydrolipoamide dehydrogenase (E3) component